MTHQVDLHLDTPTAMLWGQQPFTSPAMQAGLGALRAGETTVAVEVLWPPKPNDDAYPDRGRDHCLALLAGIEATLATDPTLHLARSPADLDALESGDLALVLAMEGANGLGTDWRADLDMFHQRGLSILTVTWSFSNRFGGSSTGRASGGPLTAVGHELIAEARSRGILLDVSHTSIATASAVLEGATAPVIASHSNCAALHPSPRNLLDKQIRAIADTGGVVGLVLHQPFIGGTRDLEALLDHAEHLAKVGGHAVVALGSDFDGGIRPPAEIPTAAQLDRLWEGLRQRGWTADQIDAARGQNALRAWAGARASASPPAV